MHSSRRTWWSSLASLVFAVACVACVAPDEVEEDREASFTSGGKADEALAIADGSPQALGALRLANSATVGELREDAGLSRRAAQNILAFRAAGRTFYTLADLDAVPYVGPVSLELLADEARARPGLFGPALQVGALPAELAADPSVVGLIESLAADASLSIDGDATTLTANEWERGLLFAHHIGPEVPAAVAALRSYFVATTPLPSGPFVDIATAPRASLGAGPSSWAADGLLVRGAADPHRVPGRLTAAELDAATADRWFADDYPGFLAWQLNYVDVWHAEISEPAPSDLPPERARMREVLAALGLDPFTGPYPAEGAIPEPVAALALGFPFVSGTEVLCMQGNNTMSASASHNPNELRYAVDFNAPGGTPLVAVADGTVYVYGGGRVGMMDNWAFGNIALIDLGNGYAAMYAHVGSFSVENGADVVAGQPIGIIGNSGPAGDEPQLHFQIVPLFRTPDPEHEAHQADSFDAAFPDSPFGGPERFFMPAIDLTVGDGAPRRFDSVELASAEGQRLLGAGHIYRAP